MIKKGNDKGRTKKAMILRLQKIAENIPHKHKIIN